MKVLIADKFEESGIAGLHAGGCEVIYRPDLKGSSLVDALRETEANVLVVRSTVVDEAALDAGRLALVVRAGAGYNTIDVAAASRRGIYVSNCPGKNAIAVAELAFGLMLSLDRRIPDNVIDLRAGRWNKKEYSSGRGLAGRTLGLLGLGNIGQEMVRRAAGFDMPVVVWSRRAQGLNGVLTSRDADSLGLAELGDARISIAPSALDVARRSDILSLHLALKPETRGIVGREVLEALRPGAILINTARAELVDDSALEAAVRERGLRVGLDVFKDEPSTPTAAAGEFGNALAALPGVYGTHHIGASTEQAQEAIAAETVRIITTYASTGKVPNVVNLAARTPATHMLIVRHRDRPGVLAHVFDHLRGGNINVQETENVVFEGAEAAVARINLDKAPSEQVLASVRAGNLDVLDLQVVPIRETVNNHRP